MPTIPESLPFLPNLAMLWAMEPNALGSLLSNIGVWSKTISPKVEAFGDGRGEIPLPMAIAGGVATVRLRGPMERRASFFGTVFGLASTDAVRESIRRAGDAEEVRSILLEIDSPGGSVDGLAELGDTIRSVRAKKQVIAQVDGTAASAAYYVAAQADKIFAGRTDLVGSIGTVLTLVDASKMFEEAGVRVIPITSGGLKAAGEFGTEVTPEQIAYLQGIVDFYFRDFVTAVAAGRKISVPEARALGTGEVFPAPEAVLNGLIDGLQSTDETRAKLAAGRLRRNARTARAELDLIST